MLNQGVIINGLLPNSTAAMEIMDEIFRAFKNSLQASTHKHYTKKIKMNAMQISRRKAEIARVIAGGIYVGFGGREGQDEICCRSKPSGGPWTNIVW